MCNETAFFFFLEQVLLKCKFPSVALEVCLFPSVPHAHTLFPVFRFLGQIRCKIFLLFTIWIEAKYDVYPLLSLGVVWITEPGLGHQRAQGPLMAQGLLTATRQIFFLLLVRRLERLGMAKRKKGISSRLYCILLWLHRH